MAPWAVPGDQFPNGRGRGPQPFRSVFRGILRGGPGASPTEGALLCSLTSANAGPWVDGSRCGEQGPRVYRVLDRE